MANKGRGRKPRGRYVRARIASTLTIGALATKDVISAAILNNAVDPNRISSVDATYVLDGLTAGEGPIEIYLADADYTDSEIEEAIEAAAAYDIGNLVAQEQARRKVRHIGTVSAEEPRLNDGRSVKTKLNWSIAIGNSIEVAAYNASAGTLTTGAVLTVTGQANAWF